MGISCVGYYSSWGFHEYYSSWGYHVQSITLHGDSQCGLLVFMGISCAEYYTLHGDSQCRVLVWWGSPWVWLKNSACEFPGFRIEIFLSAEGFPVLSKDSWWWVNAQLKRYPKYNSVKNWTFNIKCIHFFRKIISTLRRNYVLIMKSCSLMCFL